MKISDEKRVIEVVKDVADVIPLADGRNLTASQLTSIVFVPPTDAVYTMLVSSVEVKNVAFICSQF
jgi:hypothetical protein